MINHRDYLELIRGGITAFALFLIIVAIGNFYRFTTSTTDENLFLTPPSRNYVSRSIPTVHASDSGNANARQQAAPDSVAVGDLLIAINNKHVRDAQDFQQILDRSETEAVVKLRLLRSAENKLYNVKVRKTAIPDSFITELPGSVLVYEVTPGGVSDMAGLRAGDFIYRINGETFENANEADVILRGVESGKTILYDVIRQNERIVVPVTLAKFGLPVSLFALFLAGLVYWGTGAFIALNRPRILAARLLGMAFMCFGFFMMVLFAQRDVSFDTFAKIRTATMLAAPMFGLALWTHSKFYFPLEQPDIQARLWFVWGPYALVTASTLVLGGIVWLGIGTAIGQVIFWSSLALLVAHGLVLEFYYRKQRSTQYVKIKRPLTWVAMFSALLVVGIGVYVSKAGANTRQLGLVGFPLLLIPIAYLYSIARYQLLEMNLRVRRNVQYSIVSSVWKILLAVGLIILQLPNLYFDIPNIQFTGTSFVVLEAPPDPRVHHFWERLIIICLALALAYVFWRIGRWGQMGIDRLFNRKEYDISGATRELAEVMATKLGMEELAKGVIEKLARLMQLKRVGVMFFRDEQMCCCQESYGFDGVKWDKLCLRAGGRLIEEIKRFRSESRFSIDYLPQDIKDDYLVAGFRHVIPIRFKNRLVGTFVIGEKRSESPLNLEDLGFLASVAKQASIAIENSFLHEELTEQERMKHELNIARRIQMASLPQTTPQIKGLDIAGVSIPALEVGGDYFDYLNGVSVSEGVTVIVGDVSGKGTSAALYMSKMQGILRSLHAFDLSPRELFIRTNKLLCKDLEKKSFITAIGAFIDTTQQRLVLARAGHLPLFYYNSATAEVVMVTPKGLGLGLKIADKFDSELEERELRYRAGDIFLFVTDGITEAHTSNGGEFGEENLAHLLKQSAALDASTIRDRILEEVKRFAQEELPHDDQTVVVVKAV